jgi:hypothetical protein
MLEMFSREGECVRFEAPVEARGNIEAWLQRLVEGMQVRAGKLGVPGSVLNSGADRQQGDGAQWTVGAALMVLLCPLPSPCAHTACASLAPCASSPSQPSPSLPSAPSCLQSTVKAIIRRAHRDVHEQELEAFVFGHPAQVALLGLQFQWTADTQVGWAGWAGWLGGARGRVWRSAVRLWLDSSTGTQAFSMKLNTTSPCYTHPATCLPTHPGTCLPRTPHPQAALHAAKGDKGAMVRAARKAEAVLRDLVDITLRSDLTRTQRTNLETCITVHMHQKEVGWWWWRVVAGGGGGGGTDDW